MTLNEIVSKLKSCANAANVAGMARFGINPHKTLGISIPRLRKLARKIGTDHKLAGQLWATGIHEARILAGFVADAEKLTVKEMERWVRDFDSWDVCDMVCSNLFSSVKEAHEKASEWARREEEFVKRAGFALMAALAVHDKRTPDKKFEKFFRVIKKEAEDERNFVKKAVNWSLRQIGKRSEYLNAKAIKVAREIKNMNSKTAKWIASDALRELTTAAVKKRIKAKTRK